MTHHYHFEQGDNAKTPLLLLHGTGADEFDLIPLARQISPDATLLSIRGNVVEHGQNRYFSRLPDGTFDQQDLRLRTHALADFIAEIAPKHGIDMSTLVALGFSNGANVASAMMFLRPEILPAAILLRGMVPFVPENPVALDGKKIILQSGMEDPIIPIANAKQLAEIYRVSGAEISHHLMPTGHGLMQQDMLQVRAWLQSHYGD